MSDRDVTELRRLAEEIGDRVVLPPFGGVATRARRRRARQTVAGVAAAVVVAAVAVGVTAASQRGARPAPAAPTTPPTASVLPSAVAELAADPRSHPFALAGNADGSVAVVWRDLVQPGPTFALVVRDAAGTVRGRLIDQPFDLTAVPGGWVGSHGADPWFVGTDGSVADLTVDPATVVPSAGDVLVPTIGRFLLWRAGKLFASDLPADTAAALVTDTGVVATYAPGRGVTVGDVRVVVPEGTRGVLFAGRGDHVSAVAVGDSPSGSIPALGVLLAGAGGDAGRFLSPAESGIEVSASLVVDAAGFTWSTDDRGRLTVLDPRGDRAPVDPDVAVTALTPAGDRVYGLDALTGRGPLHWSDDGGATWHEDVVPGR